MAQEIDSGIYFFVIVDVTFLLSVGFILFST